MREAEADHVVAIPKFIDATVDWTYKHRDVRASLPVGNRQGQRINLQLRIAYPLPERLHVILAWRQTPIRRLDVRDNHVNPDREEEWVERTHKHRWTDLHGDGQAYTPEDIPPTDGPVTPGEYRRIVEAFCRECNIDPEELQWVDPDLGEEAR